MAGPRIDLVLTVWVVAFACASAFLIMKTRVALRRLALLRRGSVTHAVIHESLPTCVVIVVLLALVLAAVAHAIF